MARYSKIDHRLWSDAKFRALSSARPNAQTLWFFLMTCPLRAALPGLFSASERTLAEILEWPVSSFRRAWDEIAAARMARADWRARLVWLPNAIAYDPPQSLNVAKAWGHALDSLPECPLRNEAYAFIDAYLQGIGEAFGDAFRKAFRKPKDMPSPMAKPIPSPVPIPSPSPSPEPSPMPSATKPGERGGKSTGSTGSTGTPPKPGPPEPDHSREIAEAWGELRTLIPSLPEQAFFGITPALNRSDPYALPRECSRRHIDGERMTRICAAFDAATSPTPHEAEG